MANVPDPRPASAVLREFVAAGGTLVLGMGPNIPPDRYQAALGSLLPAPLGKTRSLASASEEPVPLEVPAGDTSWFEGFREGSRRAIGRIGSWRVVTLESGATPEGVNTLLRYEGGMPALVERRVGAGRVLLWTSTLDLGWSNLPLQAAFLPLIQRVVRESAGGGGNQVQLDVTLGDEVRFPVPEGVPTVTLEGPQGSTTVDAVDGHVQWRPELPGAYQVNVGDTPLGWIAANVQLDEGDVRHLHSVKAVQADIQPEMFMQHADLSPWLLLLAGLAFGAAGLLAREEDAP